MKPARLALAGIALLLTTVVPTAAANASSTGPTTTDRASALQARIDRAIAANPGAHQVSATEVALDEGVSMLFPSGPSGVSGAGGCRRGYLCLFEHIYYDGAVLAVHTCGWVDLMDYDITANRNWAYTVSSWWDSRTGADDYARLYDDQRTRIGYTDRPREEDWVGGWRNDRLRFVNTC